MKVELYSDLYFLDVVKLVENFHKEAVGEYYGSIDQNAIIDTIKSTDKNASYLLIIDGVCQGILSGVCFTWMTTGRPAFQEIIWYVNPAFRRYGIKLLREVEKQLTAIGVSTMIMAVLENSKTEKIKRFYERLGFKPMETHYVRNLTSPEHTSPA